MVVFKWEGLGLKSFWNDTSLSLSMYIIYFLHRSLMILAFAYITRVIPIIEINKNLIVIFVLQGDLLLSNMFPYMPRTKPVTSIRKILS